MLVSAITEAGASVLVSETHVIPLNASNAAFHLGRRDISEQPVLISLKCFVLVKVLFDGKDKHREE